MNAQPSSLSSCLTVSNFVKEGITLHIDEESNDRIPKKSEHVPVRGYENEYLVGLDVFHQLHCLVSCTTSVRTRPSRAKSKLHAQNTIRKAFYPSRYNISFFHDDGTVNYLEWMHIGKFYQMKKLKTRLISHRPLYRIYSTVTYL